MAGPTSSPSDWHYLDHAASSPLRPEVLAAMVPVLADVPGTYCDTDHRDEWPRGGTHPDNCHLLCRRHHRAKQFYFAQVTLDPTTGDTCWTTHEGTTYRRPPPRW
jgi:hypothetical protein